MDLVAEAGGGAAAAGPRRSPPGAAGLETPGGRPPPAGDAPDRALDGPVPAASSGATTWTRCRPATSATSSWSAASPAAAVGRRSPRWRSSTRPTSRIAASSARSPWPGCTGWSPRARRCGSLPERSAPCTSSCLDRRAVKRGGRCVDNVAMREPADRNWSEHEVERFLDQLAAGGQDYRRLVERLPVIVYTAELGEHGSWRYVSPQVEEILGYTAEEFNARSRALGQHPPPGRPPAGAGDENEDHLGDRDTTPIEYRVHRRDGGSSGCSTRRFWKPTRTGCRSGTASSTTSAERKETEEELQRALSQQAVVATPRRAGAAEQRRPPGADGGRDRADRRSRRRPQRLHLGGRPRRPPPQPPRRPRGVGRRSRPPRLRRPRLPRRRRARLRHPRRSSPTGSGRAASRCRRCCASSAPPAASRW